LCLWKFNGLFIWHAELDPPLILYFPCLLLAFLRLVRLGMPCNPGCHESFRLLFSFFKGAYHVVAFGPSLIL
jgi:hypothetical protein